MDERDRGDATVGSLPAPPVAVRAHAAPVQIGRFTPVRVIGRGSTATVYAARAADRAGEVAVKVVRAARLAADPELRARAVAALRAVAAVAHPNVAAVYDAGEVDDAVYVAMELVGGTTLASWLAAARRPAREIVRVFVAAGRGLAAAHAAGVVHRDVKPENVLVDATGRAVMVDFAVACAPPGERRELADLAIDDLRARSGSLAGTPRSYAPEQLRGEVDARSDQFAFAVALAEALSGHHPFAGDTLGELSSALAAGRRHARATAPGVPAGVERALDRALQIAPDARYPRLDDLLADLEAANAAPRRSARRRRAIALAAAAVVVVVVAVAVGATVLRRGADGGAAAAPADASGAASAAGADPDRGGRLVVLITPLDNATGDPRLDDTLDVAMGDEVMWSHAIDVFVGADLGVLATTAGTDTRHVGVIASWFVQQGRRVAVVRGRVERDGSGFAIAIDATAGGLAPVHATARAPDADATIAAAADLGARLRAWGGTRDDAAAPAHPPQTASLAAERAYVAASRERALGNTDRSAAAAREALAIDPELAEAHALLGLELVDGDDRVAGADELSRALAARRALPDRIRLMTVAAREVALGHSAASVIAYRQLLATWPHDVEVEQEATDHAIEGHRWADALELARAATTDRGNAVAVRANLMVAELGNENYFAAKAAADELLTASHVPVAGVSAAVAAYVLAGESPDYAFQALDDQHEAGAALLRADVAYYRGQRDVAEQILTRSVDAALAAHGERAIPSQLVLLAHIRLAHGDRERARQLARIPLVDRLAGSEYIAASILVDAGTLDEARAAVERWRASPLADYQHAAVTLAADLAFARGDTAAALAGYRTATADGATWLTHARFARALLAAGDRDGAVRELTWCHDHRGAGAILLASSLWLVADADRELASLTIK